MPSANTLPVRIRLAALTMSCGVTWLSVPTWSSLPQRPQFLSFSVASAIAFLPTLMSIGVLPFLPLVSIPVAVRGPPAGAAPVCHKYFAACAEYLRPRNLFAASPVPITLPQLQNRELRHEAVEFRRRRQGTVRRGERRRCRHSQCPRRPRQFTRRSRRRCHGR